MTIKERDICKFKKEAEQWREDARKLREKAIEDIKTAKLWDDIADIIVEVNIETEEDNIAEEIRNLICDVYGINSDLDNYDFYESSLNLAQFVYNRRTK